MLGVQLASSVFFERVSIQQRFVAESAEAFPVSGLEGIVASVVHPEAKVQLLHAGVGCGVREKVLKSCLRG
jgi:hypothetical protein